MEPSNVDGPITAKDLYLGEAQTRVPIALYFQVKKMSLPFRVILEEGRHCS